MAFTLPKNFDSKAIDALLASVALKSSKNYDIEGFIKTIAAPQYRMPPLKELEKRWSEFKTHFAIYEASYEAYRYIGRLLTAREFTDNQSGFYNEKEASSYTELFNALNRKDNDYYHMEVTPKTINTRLNFNDIKVTLNLAGDTQRLMDAETILKSLFPKYKTPTKWEKKNIESQTNIGGRYNNIVYSVGEDLTNTIPIKKFGDIKPRFTPTNTKTKPEDLKFALPKRYTENNFDNIAQIKLTLKQSDVQPAYGSSSQYLSQNEGPLGDGSFKPAIQVEIEVLFNWPVEFAYYVTCANGPADFIPFLFFQYLSWHKSVYGGGRTRGGGFGVRPSRINHLGNILDRNTKEQQKGRNPKIRTNVDGFLTIGVGEASETGNVYHIPSNVNKISDYLSQIKGSFDGTTNRIDLSKIKLKGEGLYADPYNEKFTYIREEGVRATAADVSGIQTIDLTGSVPLDNITIFKNMDVPLSTTEEGDFEWFMSIIRKFLQGDMRSRGALPSKQYGSGEYLTSVGLVPQKIADKGNLKDYINGVVYSFSNHGLKFGWANIGGQPMKLQPLDSDDIEETKNPEKFKDLRACFNLIKDVSGDMLTQFDNLGLSYHDKLAKLRYILFMITKYSAQYPSFKTEHDNAVFMNQINPISDAAFKAGLDGIVLPNLTGVTRYMPHQLETYIQMDPPPLADLTEVSAGGGKTIIQLAEIAKLFYEKAINRAIVVVPGNLVRNWINEITEFSKGKINVFALNINTLRRMQYVYNQNPDPVQKPDYDMLKKIIMGLPRNTIIVTSYRFLANDREKIVYGNKVIQRYYIAEFLRDIGFDLVALDESHTAKNLASNSTTAVAILLSPAKYKRELSGTAVFDNVGDLVGQSGIMVPAALGSKSRFTATFAGEEGDWDINAPRKITDAMRPYIKRITHKRQKWAAMLPQLIESFDVVNMTDKQYQFYNSILESKLEELKKANPKLYAKLLDSNDKDAKAIESGLATYFQAVEQFIYAPDSNEAFTNLEDLQPEDLISPKVAKVVEILDKHFNGFTDDLKRTHAPDTHKVIVFSHRTKTSEHMMRHLPANYQKIAVRYVAGDYQALQQFLNNDKIKILVADELSINTGQNLQIASRMIRLETLWSPGSQEQAIARIWRPAFKEGSDRQKVFMNWIYTNYSLEVTKIGRLISKIITKTRYDQQDNPAFVKNKMVVPQALVTRYADVIPAIRQSLPVNEMLGELPLLKMNLKSMQKYNERSTLNEYFAYYSLINNWEDQEFDRLKAEDRYTKTLTIPQSAYKVIPDSKSIPYTPRVPGVKPEGFDPQNKYGYQPISIVEEQTSNTGDDETDNEDDIEENEVEINPVDINTVVDTEFGFGRVTKLLQKEVWVDVSGIEIKVPKTTAWVITNKDAENEVIRRITQGDPKSNLRLPPQVVSALPATRVKTTKPLGPELAEEEHEEEIKIKPSPIKHEPIDEYDEEEEEEKQLPIWASIVDTQIALTTEYAPETEFLVDEEGWRLVPPYTAIQIPNAAALERVLSKLTSKYQIHSTYLKNLEYYKTMLQNHSLDVAQPNMVNATIRFFAQEEHKKLKDSALRPFPIIWDGNFWIAFDKQTTPALKTAINDVKALGISKLSILQQPSNAIKFYSNKEAALQDLKNLNKHARNPHLADALKVLENVKIKRNTAPTPAPTKTSIVPKFDAPQPKQTPTIKLSVNKTEKTQPKPAPKINTAINPTTNKPAFKLNLGKLGKIR